MLRPESRCVRPQALPLRSHHFQKVGKKPELTLVWEPEDLEQEPVRQVRAGGQGRFSRPALCPGPPPSSGGGSSPATLRVPSGPRPPHLGCLVGVQSLHAKASNGSPTPPPLGRGFPVPPSSLGAPTVGRGGGLRLSLEIKVLNFWGPFENDKSYGPPTPRNSL